MPQKLPEMGDMSWSQVTVMVLWLLATTTLAEEEKEESDTVSGHEKMVICYWGTWANYR